MERSTNGIRSKVLNNNNNKAHCLQISLQFNSQQIRMWCSMMGGKLATDLWNRYYVVRLP